MNKVLSEAYFNLENPSAFTSIKNVYKISKKRLPKLKISDVKNWLTKQDVYTLFRRPTRQFQRSQFVSSVIDRFWSADLMDIKKYSQFNDNYKFLIVVIDNLSKFAFIQPIKK